MNKKQLEQREDALARNAYHCHVCNESIYKYNTPMYAHKIADTTTNRSIWGSWIIDHTLNGEYVCCLKCNDKMNIGNNKGKCLDLVQDILLYERRKFDGCQYQN